MQEFLAAYFISQLEYQGAELFYSYDFSGLDQRFDVVWRFLAGLTKLQCCKWVIAEKLTEEDEGSITVGTDFILCLFEAQSSIYFDLDCKAHQKIVFATFLKNNSSQELYALGFCVANYHFLPWDIALHDCENNYSNYHLPI